MSKRLTGQEAESSRSPEIQPIDREKMEKRFGKKSDLDRDDRQEIGGDHENDEREMESQESPAMFKNLPSIESENVDIMIRNLKLKITRQLATTERDEIVDECVRMTFGQDGPRRHSFYFRKVESILSSLTSESFNPFERKKINRRPTSP